MKSHPNENTGIKETKQTNNWSSFISLTEKADIKYINNGIRATKARCTCIVI